ncbi:MAG: NAD-dependent epimerase/dehydratase family protein [Thermoleophilaceae bacterium]|nr:NAD-dependent epimerase/dehydratase family protein [Thermoleophilaceae bacterium]
MNVSLTGGTGFVGGHVLRDLIGRGDTVRAVHRSPEGAEPLQALGAEPVRADALDRAALRRAFKGSEIVFHVAGRVGSRPRKDVWEANALAPRIVVEAAAAEGVRRVVVTSSVAGVGPARPGEVADEDSPFRGGGLGLTYVDAKHEGETEALAAGARCGIEVVTVNPSYVFGVPVDPAVPGENSTRMIGNYLRGRLPGVVDARSNFVDVGDVAAGHLAAADRGEPGERYILGGHNLGWVELIERVRELSGVSHPLVVIPREVAYATRVPDALGLPSLISAEAYVLMAQEWTYSSAKARRELGYKARPLRETLKETVDWYLELIDSGAFRGEAPSRLSLASFGLRAGGPFSAASALRLAQRRTRRQLVAGE